MRCQIWRYFQSQSHGIAVFNRPILPKRRGATIAPNNGVPLVLNGKRSQVKQDMAVSHRA